MPTFSTVKDGDICESISVRQTIALKDLYFLNPGIDSQCLNLWLNGAYCVQAVGDINRYPGYPSTSTVYNPHQARLHHYNVHLNADHTEPYALCCSTACAWHEIRL